MLETADLPADMAHEFDEIEALLMRHVDEAPGGTGGVLLHTLMRLQDGEVRDRALRILKLYEEVKELANRPIGALSPRQAGAVTFRVTIPDSACWR